ncbi:hypothetical protein AOLI_G00136920 [Acnodon oligacanthus]
MKVAHEAEAETTTEPMDINLDDTQKEPLKKHLGNLVSKTEEKPEASELLEIELEEEVSESFQLLGE